MSTVPTTREEWVAKREADNAAQIRAIEDGCRFCGTAIEAAHSIAKTGELLVIGATVAKVEQKNGTSEYFAFHSKCIEERTKTTREVRACTGCGYKRKVKVSRWFNYRTADIDERVAEKCNACETMSRARYYARLSNTFHAQAMSLYAKQGTKPS